MHYEAYTLNANKENTRFHFKSKGKRGIFEKVILITRINHYLFNLSLLDYDLTAKQYSDIAITDNGDLPEVLATVLAAVKIFLNEHPDKSIYFEGSTSARTRLYQIVINKIYDPFTSEFEIFGMKNSVWTQFEANINYDGFLIEKRS